MNKEDVIFYLCENIIENNDGFVLYYKRLEPDENFHAKETKLKKCFKNLKELKKFLAKLRK